MKLEDYLEKHGSTKTARALINQRINSLIGMSMDDLADDCEMDNMFWTIKEALDEGDLKGARGMAREITMEFIEDNIFG